jgi:hypothetical protein
MTPMTTADVNDASGVPTTEIASAPSPWSRLLNRETTATLGHIPDRSATMSAIHEDSTEINLSWTARSASTDASLVTAGTMAVAV